MYAYGDAAYAMYEKAPEQIQVSFPIICGVIADFNNMQTMIQEFLENTQRARPVVQNLSLRYQQILRKLRKKLSLISFIRAK